MKKIILVRHGESIGNTTWELMGWRIGSHLSEKWILQARQAANYIAKNYQIDIFYSSPVQRTIETSEIIKKEIRNAYILNDDLREIDFWDMTGRKLSEIPEEIDLAYKKDPFLHRHSWGENMADVFQRVEKFLQEEIYPSLGNEILIVTHHNTIKAFVWVLTWITREVVSLKIGNCTITEYLISDDMRECIHFNLNWYLK